MANSLAAIQRQNILGQALRVLRSKTVMPQLSYRGIEAGRASGNLNDTINVPKPKRRGTRAATTSHLPQAAGDTATSTIPLVVDQWQESDPFYLTDKEVSLFVNPDEHFLPMEMAESVSALAEFVNAQILANYVDVYGFTGTPGTTAFTGGLTGTAADAANAQAIALAQRSRPLSSVVMEPYTAAAAKINAQLSDYDKTGSGFTRVEASLGKKMSMEWFEDQQAPVHTAGTAAAAGDVLTNGAVLAGVKTLNVDSATGGTLVIGDIIVFTGDTQTYTVTAAVADVTAAAVAFEPALAVDIGDNVGVEVKATHKVNLAFAENAFALTSVPLLVPAQSRRQLSSVRDPLTGLVLRLEFVDQHNQSYWKFDVLFGSKCINPEYAVRIVS